MLVDGHFFASSQADNCKLQKDKNYAAEEAARRNRIRIHHELATARRDGVAQVRDYPAMGTRSAPNTNTTDVQVVAGNSLLDNRMMPT